MPLYEYECEACGHRLEAQQKLADAPLTKCPACGKEQLQKLISATSFTLKGGGWYKDLYSSAKPGSESASSSSEGGSSSNESKGSEGDKGVAAPATPEKTAKGGDSKPSGDSKPAPSSSTASSPSSSTPSSSTPKS